MAPIHALALALLGGGLAGCGGGSGADLASAVPFSPQPTFTPGVAFLADAEVDERVELYVADLDGDGSLKVSGPLVAGGDVASFQWSPDRALLAFLADKDADDVLELFVVPAGGGQVTKVSGPLVAGGDVRSFRWSPDSARLAYLADEDQDEVFELFGTSAQGGQKQVSGQLPVGGGVLDFAWAPDSTRIAYLADQDTLNVVELYTVLAVGGGNVRVSGALVPGGTVRSSPIGAMLVRPAFAWSPDSSRVAYLATQDVVSVTELFTSLAAGGGNHQVNAPLTPPASLASEVLEFAWASDSQRLAYSANQEVNDQGDVFVAAPDGSGNTKVFDADTGNMFAVDLRFTPDGTRVAGRATFVGFGIPEGYPFAAPAGGPPVVGSFNECLTYELSPDSTAIAFANGTVVGGVPFAGLYGAGAAPTISSLAPGERVRPESLRWSPDGARVAFLSRDLHVSFPTTAYGAERVTPQLEGTDRSVRKFQWTPDPWGIVFTADIAAAGVVEMFLSPRDAASLVTLSQPLVFGGQVLDFEVR